MFGQLQKVFHPYFFAIANKLTHRVGGCAHITRGTASSHPPYHTKPYHVIPYSPPSYRTIPHTLPYQTICTIPYHKTTQYTPHYTIQHHTPLYQPTLRPLARFMSDMNFARPAEALPAKVSHQDLFFFYTFTFCQQR